MSLSPKAVWYGNESKNSVARTLAWAVISIALMTFLGYVLRIGGLAGWTFTPNMAVNTAVCLLLLGIAVLVLARKEKLPHAVLDHRYSRGRDSGPEHELGGLVGDGSAGHRVSLALSGPSPSEG